MGGPIVVDTPDGIEFYQLLQFQGRFKLELMGYHSRVNTLQAYNAKYGTKFKTRKKAAQDCRRRIEEMEAAKQEQVQSLSQIDELAGKLGLLTVKQLREVCRENGMSGYSSLKRDDLVKFILQTAGEPTDG